MLKKVSTFVAVMLVAGATVFAAEVDLDGVKCVVANKDANAGKSAKYKDGTVYFCCGGCAGKFAKDSKKFANKANHQLVATKQYEQKACPMSGGPVDASVSSKVAGTKVNFCCNKCKGAVDKASSDKEKLELVFSDKAFKKAYKKVGKKTSK